MGLAAAVLLLVTISGLVLGRLPLLNLPTRSRVSALLVPVALLAGVALRVYGGGPAGQIYFGTDVVHVDGIPRLRQPQRFFNSGEEIAWLAYLSRPAGPEVELKVWFEGMYGYGPYYTATASVPGSGATVLFSSDLELEWETDSGWYLFELRDPGGDTLAQGGVYVLRSAGAPPP